MRLLVAKCIPGELRFCLNTVTYGLIRDSILNLRRFQKNLLALYAKMHEY